MAAAQLVDETFDVGSVPAVRLIFNPLFLPLVAEPVPESSNLVRRRGLRVGSHASILLLPGQRSINRVHAEAKQPSMAAVSYWWNVQH